MKLGSSEAVHLLAARNRHNLNLDGDAMGKSLSGKGKQAAASTSSRRLAAAPATDLEPVSVQTVISRLAASLPPSAPASASLNPLADLVDLYANLPLSPLPDRATTAEREQNRQAVHSALHSLKAVFEHLIKHGRLHGVLKSSAKRVKSDSGKRDGTVTAQEDETVLRVKEWLKERWHEYLEATAKVISTHWESGVRVSRFLAQPLRKNHHDADVPLSLFPCFAALGLERPHVARQDRIPVSHLARSGAARQVRRADARLRRPGSALARERRWRAGQRRRGGVEKVVGPL